MKPTMTLGEFRKYTEHLSDDIELNYAHSDGFHPIKTFANAGESTLVLATSNWMIPDIEGIIVAVSVLKRKHYCPLKKWTLKN